jgi:hypothetical protein
MDWTSNLLKYALLLRGFVVAVLDGIKERAAIPAVGAWARVVVWITPGLLVLVAMFAVSSGFALIGIFAGAILPIRGGSKRPWLYWSVLHVTVEMLG